jgi:hypothetical protein
MHPISHLVTIPILPQITMLELQEQAHIRHPTIRPTWVVLAEQQEMLAPQTLAELASPVALGEL